MRVRVRSHESSVLVGIEEVDYWKEKKKVNEWVNKGKVSDRVNMENQ